MPTYFPRRCPDRQPPLKVGKLIARAIYYTGFAVLVAFGVLATFPIFIIIVVLTPISWIRVGAGPG